MGEQFSLVGKCSVRQPPLQSRDAALSLPQQVAASTKLQSNPERHPMSLISSPKWYGANRTPDLIDRLEIAQRHPANESHDIITRAYGVHRTELPAYVARFERRAQDHDFNRRMGAAR